MEPNEIRELLELAQALEGELVVAYRGDVTVEALGDGGPLPDTHIRGFTLTQGLLYVGPGDPDGEGWEYYSAEHGATLTNPRIYLDAEDGRYLSIAEARARLSAAPAP